MIEISIISDQTKCLRVPLQFGHATLITKGYFELHLNDLWLMTIWNNQKNIRNLKTNSGEETDSIICFV